MSDCWHNAPNREPDAGDVQTQWQQLDDQTREQLVDRLVDCLYSFEGESDLAALDRCLEDLEKAGAECEPFDVEQGLQDFHERFGDAFVSSPQEVKKPKRRYRPLARIAIIAAALFAFVFTAQASGVDILGAIARWTSEQFAFVKTDEKKDERVDSLSDKTLQEVLVNVGVTEQLAPTWFPDNTEMREIRVLQDTGVLMFSATYDVQGDRFFISIRAVDERPYMDIEINNQNVEVHVAGGIEHHIMTDVKQKKVMWYNGKWECYIAGDLDKDDLLMMIDSIYE